MKLASYIECSACMACVDSCHYNALSVEIDTDGFFKIAKHTDACTNCGLCSKVCPIISPLQTDHKDVNSSFPYAAWCEDSVLRGKAASGGAFAAMAKAFLERGGIVYGAAINGFDVIHKRLDHIDDLPSILGSKYQHSKLQGVYTSVRDDLRAGRKVLFSGLSCQIAGMKKFIGNRLQDNLYTIDTICGGIATMLPMIHLQRTGNYLGISSFRDKDNGWKSRGFQYALKMIDTDGNLKDLGMDNMVLKCFCHKETKRSSCLDCKFNGFHRDADCTIGDFWGDQKFAEQHKDGLSLLIMHSMRIRKIVEASDLHLEPIGWLDFVGNNIPYYWNHYPFYRSSLARKMIFYYLRKGNNDKATEWLEKNCMIKRIEAKLNYNRNESERKEFLSEILSKTEK